MPDITEQLQETVKQAIIDHTPLKISGGNSKAFYGRACEGKTLAITHHQGILNYEPSELVVTARAGTPLQALQTTLAERGQWLAFEPPHFAETATLGGTIACGLSGPARPYLGSARDFVLGVKCLNGQGEVLRFGGQVMKNVAGYDVSRLMTGALGTLGVLLEISCKVLPLPPEEITLVIPTTSEEHALQQMVYWGNQSVPLTASCFDGEKIILRLAGIEVQVARQKIPAEVWNAGAQFWTNLREQRLDFFKKDTPLWRLSVPPTAPPLGLSGTTLIEWGGAQRWLHSDLPTDIIRNAVAKVGGHATLFRGGNRNIAIFHPLSPPLENLHSRLKQQFDPQGLLNRYCMAAGW